MTEPIYLVGLKYANCLDEGPGVGLGWQGIPRLWSRNTLFNCLWEVNESVASTEDLLAVCFV